MLILQCDGCGRQERIPYSPPIFTCWTRDGRALDIKPGSVTSIDKRFVEYLGTVNGGFALPDGWLDDFLQEKQLCPDCRPAEVEAISD